MATSTSPVSERPSVGDSTSGILVRFTPSPYATTEQYDETIARLERLGDWPPDGLEYHVAFRTNGHFRVNEIWDSRDQFEAFDERFAPILKDVGIVPSQPELLEIHNIVKR